MPLGIRFRQNTLDRIDDALNDYEFRNRSNFIVAAVKRYLVELEEEMDEAEEDEEIKMGSSSEPEIAAEG